ncbi:hypothetical protein ACHHRT_12445, partial [Desulfurivibrio sp. D14AmB]|uniref:hypothetical protein n=1 Tax=Desulfurivibrio sp. D14AmB TaxID=3374370 RepID=UPI00376EEA48
GLSIILNEIRYQASMELGFGGNIECYGHVPKTVSYFDGASVDVGFFECEAYGYGDFPKNIFYGRFRYLPSKDTSPLFILNLRYFAGDERDLRFLLLNQEVKTQLILQVNLAIKKDELIAATNELQGAVQGYSFEVRRGAST